jgi:hypothetical protein
MKDLFEAIIEYQKRDRRYGGINQPSNRKYALG